MFLWPNTAPVLQPMDQGVIRGLKAHHQKQYVRKLIRSLDKNAPLPDAKDILVSSCNVVLTETIVDCFRKARISGLSQ